jgi:hypothetical protein
MHSTINAFAIATFAVFLVTYLAGKLLIFLFFWSHITYLYFAGD